MCTAGLGVGGSDNGRGDGAVASVSFLVPQR